MEHGVLKFAATLRDPPPVFGSLTAMTVSVIGAEIDVCENRICKLF